MLANILQRATNKTPMQNPLNREVYSISLAAARNQSCKTHASSLVHSTRVGDREPAVVDPGSCRCTSSNIVGHADQIAFHNRR